MNSIKQETQYFKVVLIGDGKCGKTTLVSTYLHKKLKSEAVSRIRSCFISNKIYVNKTPVKLNIWDFTFGQNLQFLMFNHCKRANAILVIYDKSDYKSFQSTKNLAQSFTTEIKQKALFLVVANKIDMYSDVSTDEGIEFALNLGACYIEVSAKTRENLDLCFEIVARACLG